MQNQGLLITAVEPASIAAEMGLKPGDKLLSINRQPVRDIIDYRFFTATEELVAQVLTSEGETWDLEIEKDYEEDLGLDFGEHAFGPTRTCRNNCMFCFVDQMAPNMRSTLYIRDDDYRLSFWQGNFISLTNVKDEELQRMINQKMGPLYISVHTTNPDLRRRMLNNRHAGKIMDQLRQLAAGGIEMNTQAVLCPGVNDGPEMERSISDLAGLWPQVHSMAVVPVGLTKFREGLKPIRTFTKEEAVQVVDTVEKYQHRFLAQWDYPFVFASDEFFLLAEKPIPSAEYYADFPQTENGVGLVRLFWDEWEAAEADLPEQITKPRTVTMITGVSSAKILQQVADRLNQVKGLKVNLEVIVNKFFGESVTVTGLLTGQDIINALSGKELGEFLILPAVVLRDEEDLFLDDLTLADVVRELNITVKPVTGPTAMVEALLTD